MKPEGSSPCSQEPATCSYPEPDQTSSRPFQCHLFKRHFNVILPSTLGSSKWSPSNRVSHQNPVFNCPFSRTCDMSFFPIRSRKAMSGEQYVSWSFLTVQSSRVPLKTVRYQNKLSASRCVMSAVYDEHRNSHLITAPVETVDFDTDGECLVLWNVINNLTFSQKKRLISF